MFYLTMHSTNVIYGYMASKLNYLVKDHSDSERRNPLPPLHGLLFPILLYAPSHRLDSTYHGFWYTSREALARTRNYSVGKP